MEIVSAEVTDVNPHEKTNFASNSVFGKTPKFVDLGISPAHTADKPNSIFAPAIRSGVLMDNYNCLAPRHGIVKVTAERVSKAKSYSDYIKNSELETMNFFEREIILEFD